MLQKDFPTEQDWFKYLELWVDLGYLGIDKKYKIEQLHIPHKKPRKSKQNPTASLREEEKLANKVMSQFRVVVENAIAGIKRYGILVQKLRTQSEAFADDVIELCAGLWNFKLSFKNSK